MSGRESTNSAGAHLFRGAAALLSTQPFTWGVSLLATILLPHYLSDQGLGAYAVATTVATIACTVGALGIPSVVVRQVAGDESQTHTTGPASLLVVTVSGLLMCVLTGLVLPITRVSETERTLIQLALVGTVATLGNKILASVLNGQSHHARQAWLNAAGTAGGTLAGLVALVAGAGASGFLAANAALTFLTVALGWRMCGFGLRQTISPRTCVDLVRRGVPFLAWGVAMQIRNQIDVVVVAGVLGASAAGWLAAAYRIVFIPMFLPSIIITPLFPLLSRSLGDPAAFNRSLRQAFKTVLVLTVPASAMVMACAPAVPNLLHWEAEFQRSIPLMSLLALDQPLGAIDMVLGTALMALRRERRWLAVGLIAAAFNPMANLVLLPLAQGTMDNPAIVAALVELATEVVMMVGTVLLLPRGCIGREQASLAVRVTLAGVALVVSTRALLGVSLVLGVACGGLVFLLVALLLRVITQDDVLTVMHLARSTFGSTSAQPRTDTGPLAASYH